MALGKVVNLVGIDDCKFTPNGGAATDIFGIQGMNIDVEGFSVMPTGDGTILDYISKKTNAKVTFKEAVLSLTSFGILTGATVVDAGVTPAQTSTLQITDGILPYGVLDGTGKIVDTLDTGTAVAQVKFEIKRFRVDPSTIKIVLQEKTAVAVDFGGVCVPVSGVVVEITYLETAV